MIIDIIAVGKIKEKYINEGIKEYTKRLSRYTTLNIIEVDDEKAPESLSDKDQDIIKKKEGERILSKISQDAYVIALSIDGKGLSSEGLAEKLQNLMVEGSSHISFIIGGSLGLSKEILKRAQMKLSFSKMTFPHQLMRMILLEQVYRSFRIIRNEPYHK
ncbi:MAG: 23S rRNA (pseudouridine(1915)-N(3))-methyltransferase RlmH [Gudongella sp.]|nr:23S rRNA (pseudouridine(1915)-N(3))-methyltransferase RlmH [Gudongella sp.]